MRSRFFKARHAQRSFATVARSQLREEVRKPIVEQDHVLRAAHQFCARSVADQAAIWRSFEAGDYSALEKDEDLKLADRALMAAGLLLEDVESTALPELVSCADARADARRRIYGHGDGLSLL